MTFDLKPYNKPFNLILKIRAMLPVRLLVSIYDPISETVYIDRKVHIGGARKLTFKLPIVPDRLRVRIIERELPIGDKHFRLEEIKVVPDTKCPVDLTKGDKTFIKFAKWFATNFKSLTAGSKGTIYQSGKFNILLLDQLLDHKGKVLTTPARIGKGTGIIEVNKSVVEDYTLPMLMLVLLHEYAHFYKNPEYGREISNELSADLIALNLALNLGFDTEEAKACFKSVFAKKNTRLNRRRNAAINEYIQRFKAREKDRCQNTNIVMP